MKTLIQKRGLFVAISLSILFLVKALVLGMFITPLWDVPDESGHYAYALHIAEGKGIPVHGKTYIKGEVFESWMGRSGKTKNWITQHPPLYHLTIAPIINITKRFTNDNYWIFRTPRIITAIAGALTLLVLYLIFLEISKSEVFALSISATIGFIPMYSHMSSGTNHDIFVTLLSALSIYYWTKFVKTNQFKNGFFMGGFISLASITKVTALAYAVPLILITFFYLRPFTLRKVINYFFIGLTSAILPIIWMFNNIRSGNSLINTTIIAFNSETPYHISYLDYLLKCPAVDHLLKNFFALIGWTGGGQGKLEWFQISGVFYFLILYALSCFFIISIYWYIKFVFWKSNIAVSIFKKIVFLIFVLVFIFSFTYLFSNFSLSLIQKFVYSTIMATLFLFPMAFLTNIDSDKRIIFASIFITFTFSLMLLTKLVGAYNAHGIMRATHGRYLYPLFPFFGFIFFYPAFLFLKERFKYHYVIFLITPIFMLILELLFYVEKAIPFYKGRLF